MKTEPIKPIQALNKAFRKVKPNRQDFDNFKYRLIELLDGINEAESEEFHKKLIADFFKKTYYGERHFINTKEKKDFVIHNGKDAQSSVGVILEAKKPTAKGEMLKVDKLNVKALQQLVLYFLRERIFEKNLEVKHLIVTNVYEWFIFDAKLFEQFFADNKELVKQFQDFEEGRLSGKKTKFFYEEIAANAIEKIEDELSFTYFEIRESEEILRNPSSESDRLLIPLFKIFSPEHLLKLPFANDSNTLDKGFYSELLHIIGLEETSKGRQKLIQRQQEGDRSLGTLIENAIRQLESSDKISRLEKPEQLGETDGERLFNVALELALTWVNRVLFLKLLEAQLIAYHKGDKSFSFLNLDKIPTYNDLNGLFFEVLAKKPGERNPRVKDAFAKVPYLNSSLFETTPLEQKTILISNLGNEKLPIFSSTVLKDRNGNQKTGEINALEYLFEFLDAYDFSSEGSEDIQEENKTLINASVLGLIFEKINGYQDGSFFTPGFITTYMSRETIRRAVVQKFNEVKGFNCQTIDDLYDKIENKPEANAIINSLKICDPAVGSGHFLVSALNEIIAIKSELKILLDRQGKTLRDYRVEVENDELIVTDDDGKFFEYYPKNREKQRIQEALFHEKQTIIENCLFGVDVNPNSVKICRLRLWIELLKNSYYKEDSNYEELETLPNIDINIKCGNSLISRFALDGTLRREKSKIFDNAFEWRFEFPEALNDRGDFVGFDVVIGNPPYGVKFPEETKKILQATYPEVRQKTFDSFLFFLALSKIILTPNGHASFILPNNLLYQLTFESARKFLLLNFVLFEVVNLGDNIFEDATVPTCIYVASRKAKENYFLEYSDLRNKANKKVLVSATNCEKISKSQILSNFASVFGVSDRPFLLIKKIDDKTVKLSELTEKVSYGIGSGGDKIFRLTANFCQSNKLETELLFNVCSGSNIQKYCINYGNEKIIYTTKELDIAQFPNILKHLQPHKEKLSQKRETKKGTLPWWCLHWPRNKELYLGNKIVLRQTGDRIIAALDLQSYFVMDSVMVVKLKKEVELSLKYVLALLNSQLLNFIYGNLVQEKGRTFAQVKPKNIKQLPILIVNDRSQKPIEALVDRILATKKSNPNADTTALEKEIDRLIYQLYQLTEEEIKIVEGDV